MRHAVVSVVVFIAVMVVAACGKVASVQVEGCKADADCALTNRGEDCCDKCSPIVGTKASVAEREASCKDKPIGPTTCPSLTCRRLTETAACNAGRCVAVVKEPQ
jgi:hypothetical protein